MLLRNAMQVMLPWLFSVGNLTSFSVKAQAAVHSYHCVYSLIVDMHIFIAKNWFKKILLRSTMQAVQKCKLHVLELLVVSV